MAAWQKLSMFSFGCLILACMLEWTMTGQESVQEPSKSALFGSGHGLDHVGIAVRDLEEAKKTYRNLGFTVFGGAIHPDLGTRNSGPSFESGYLELITSRDRTKALGAMVAKFLEKQEGGLFVGLEVSVVDDTARLLRISGSNLRGPEAGSAREDLEQRDQPPNEGSWRFVGFSSGAIPAAQLPVKSSDALFFLQYDAAISNVHANTAKRLSAVWMAVRDLGASVKAYESIGFRASRQMRASQLGAEGQEIEAGQGSILLLQPENSSSRAASFLAERGAEGVMGVSIEVANLQTARSLIEAKTNRQFKTYDGPYGHSILLAPELTHGIWIELFQK
jgi:catechol 2,3-dioxygenase-like lactoylglutathione lyase family enzyme